MAVDSYNKTIMENSGVQSWQDTWIVDDVFPVSVKSGLDKKLSENGYWVRLINIDDQVRIPVRYLLADKNQVSLTGLVSEDKGLISSGRAFQVDWNHPELKREFKYANNTQTQNIWFLEENTQTAVKRNHEIEEAIDQEYKEILKMARDKVIPESELMSDLEFLKNPIINLHVMNVGQGDTIVLRFPGNRIWLIDAYMPTKDYQHVICVTEFLDWLNREYPGFAIERFIISHLHYDHIRSALSIIKATPIKTVIFSHTPVGKTLTALKVLREASDRNILYELRGIESIGKSGFGFRLVNASNLANKANSIDQNHHGIIMDMVTEKSHLLLPGDASWDQIDEFLRSSYNTIHNLTKYYKVTHHCSNTGHNINFLNRYNPDHAFTSCSNGNRYGHPDQASRAVIDRITTDHSITYECGQKSIDRLIQ
ncbi:MAG: MBL fold metallo-hydrolase [Candidatus Cloacimonetes bacterium]|nr:MBL fold metallo-hydrolase [Candidatus Cloacimonadota bacterium]